jgi:CRP-like cAMP-binding protein
MSGISNLVYEYVLSEENYSEGAVIIEEGSHGDSIYVVLEGHVKILKKTPKGTVVIDTLEEGDVFGEMVFLMKEKTRTASVVANGPVLVGILHFERLAREWESVSPHLRRVITLMAKKLRGATTKAVALANG